jgi:hypoxanthine phosphoribosyltransferase
MEFEKYYPSKINPKIDSIKEDYNLESIIKPIYNLNPKIIPKENSLSREKDSIYEIILSREDFSKKFGIETKPSLSNSFLPDLNLPNLSKMPNDAFIGKNLQELLKEIEVQSDPRKFKEVVLRTLQLYFDGLVENKCQLPNPKVWAEQLETLNAMLRGLRLTVSGFYRDNENVPFDEVREIIIPYDSTLIKHGLKRGCKKRHLDGSEYQVGRYALNLTEVLKNEELDLVIPIASGGFEPSALIADYLSINEMFPIRYSRVSRTDGGVLVPSQAPLEYPKQEVDGKRILVIDDIVASGGTFSKLAKWMKNYCPTKAYFSTVQGDQKDLKDSNLHTHNNSQHLYTYEQEPALV